MAYTVWKDLAQVERYARKRYKHWDQRWLNFRERNLVNKVFVEHHLAGEILDIPVGYGRFQELLINYGPVYAADFNYFAALYQLEKLNRANGSVNSLAEALPFRDDSFDIVFSFRLLQHIHEARERVAIFKEFKRVARHWAVVSVYVSAALHVLQRNVFKQPSRITMLSWRELKNETAAAGLTLVDQISVVPGLHAHRLCLFATEESA